MIEDLALRVWPAELSDVAFAARLVTDDQHTPPLERLVALARRPRWPYQEGSDAFFAALESRLSAPGADDILEAEEACNGRLRLPGGAFADFGSPLHWLRDPATGFVWPLVYWKRFKAESPGVDILTTWWAGSLYHLIPLGKAFAYARRAGDASGAERLSACFVDHVESWCTQNRYGFGPNWQSTTIVALRLIHLVWGHALFIASDNLSDAFRVALLKIIHRHAVHIRNNLEWFDVRTNHYLTNIYALYVVGDLFPEFREAAEWRHFGLNELTSEVEHHILEDGAVHEGSIYYHSFVVEIFLSTLVFGTARGDTFPQGFLDRIERAVEFLALAVRPDGTLARIGDAADIRLQHLDQRDYLANAGHLFNLGAVIFERGDFKAAAPELSEHALWLLGKDGADKFDALPVQKPEEGTRAFRDGGYCIHKVDGAWLMVRCGRLALDGVSGHGHYDQLSFEFWFDGRQILIDPGWYRYEGDPEAFRYFKSTAAHNTVTVDDRNQIAIDLFIYPPPMRPVPRLLDVEERDGVISIAGEHALYCDLRDPVTHRRVIRFDVAAGELEIVDRLDGADVHSLSWSFHFASSLTVEKGINSVSFNDKAVQGSVITESASTIQVDAGQDAPSYAVRRKTSIARFVNRTRLPVEMRFTIRVRSRE